jgi:cytochrome c biogenesis protein CcmG, thiol:disulfide interchange protein DsbE
VSRATTVGRGLAAAALLAVLVGCSSSGTTSTGPGPGGTNPTHAQLVAKADLRPCPPSSSTPVSGGLPDITLPCLGDGPQVHLAGLAGTPLVVNIWGSWCPPCQAEMRYLSSAYDADRGKVRFLGVDTVDDVNSALDFDAAVTPPVRFPSVVDENRKVLIDTHLPPSPPITLLISAAGKIVHTEHGAYTSTAAVQSDIAKYLHVSA